MSMKTSDRIVSSPRGSIEGAKRRARNASRQSETQEYIEQLFKYSIAAGVDPAIAFAQWDLETDTGTSYWWKERLNPAGLGITGYGPENQKSWTFTPVTAAKAQVAHLLLYATGGISRGGLVPSDDPRYDAYIRAYGNKAVATTVSGLSGTWAADQTYATKIASRANAIWSPLEAYISNETPSAPKFAPVSPVESNDGRPWDGNSPVIVGNTIVIGQKRSVAVKNLTKARRWGTLEAESVAPDYKPDEVFFALGYYRGTLGAEKGFWWITDKYYRVWAGDTYDKPFEIT